MQVRSRSGRNIDRRLLQTARIARRLAAAEAERGPAMSRAWVLILLVLLVPGSAVPDSSNLEGGVFIAHHPPGLQYTSGQDWCARYFQEFAIDSCSEQNNRIDLDGNEGAGSVWFVLAAWAEEKEWCGTEFGFAAYDSTIYVFEQWGPCFPDGSGGGLQIPTAGWPGPNAGVSLSISGTPWSGNFTPVYWFAGYAYYEGEIPLAVNPSSEFGGTANCQMPPQAFAASAFGAMGIFEDGISACPEELDQDEGGLDGGSQPDGAGDGEGYEENDGQGGGDEVPSPSVTCAENVLIVKFAPWVISFPQDEAGDPQYFEAPLADAVIALPGLRASLEQAGAESCATIAVPWRHLTPERSRDIHGNPVALRDFADIYRVTLSGAVSLDDAISILMGQPGIIHAVCDAKLPLLCSYDPQLPHCDSPLALDEYYPDQWHLCNDGHGIGHLQTCLEDFDWNVPEAWAICDMYGVEAGTKIGILDDGLNESHQDLAPFICRSLSASFFGTDWETHGWPSHGTAVASVAAAGTCNTFGLASIPNSPSSHADELIVALQVEDRSVSPPESPSQYASAILDALAHVASTSGGQIGVVNFSSGLERWRFCYDQPEYYLLLSDLVRGFRNAYHADVALVCASGNLPNPFVGDPCAGQDDIREVWPAACLDYTLAVGGVDCNGHPHHPDFEPEYYPESYVAGSYIDIAGPFIGGWVAAGGVDGYQEVSLNYQGTSNAAPVASGAIALLLGGQSNLTNEDCYELLKLTAQNPAAAGYESLVGAGMPRLDQALSWLVPPHGVEHGESDQIASVTAVGVWPVKFMNVEGLNSTEDVWEQFDVEAYRVTSVVQLPAAAAIRHVWPRGKECSGWRLIDHAFDGNPDPSVPPHYNAEFYGNWAEMQWDGSGTATTTCYTYRVFGTEQWAPFDPEGAEYRIAYSCVIERLPSAASDAGLGAGLEIVASGAGTSGAGGLNLRVESGVRGRMWLEPQEGAKWGGT